MFSFSISISSTSPIRFKPLRWIENLEQFLLFFDRKLQIRRDGVRQLRRIFHPHGRDHGLVVQRLAQLYVLLKQCRHALHRRFDGSVCLRRVAGDRGRSPP